MYVCIWINRYTYTHIYICRLPQCSIPIFTTGVRSKLRRHRQSVIRDNRDVTLKATNIAKHTNTYTAMSACCCNVHSGNAVQQPAAVVHARFTTLTPTTQQLHSNKKCNKLLLLLGYEQAKVLHKHSPQERERETKKIISYKPKTKWIFPWRCVRYVREAAELQKRLNLGHMHSSLLLLLMLLSFRSKQQVSVFSLDAN